MVAFSIFKYLIFKYIQMFKQIIDPHTQGRTQPFVVKDDVLYTTLTFNFRCAFQRNTKTYSNMFLRFVSQQSFQQ